MDRKADLLYARGLAMRNTFGLSVEESAKLSRDYSTQKERCESLYGHEATHKAIFYGEFDEPSTGNSDA
jgi:hypothetical protein